MPKTAGQSSRQRRRRGRSATREHSGTVPSPAPSCQWDTARDAAPGPQAWTSHDPETVRSPSLLGTRGLSQHAAHVEPPGHDHPHAGLSGLWPDGPAVTPWHIGQKPPPHNLYKHCQLGLTNTNRPVREDTAHPAEWWWLLDIAAWPQTAPQRGCPCTPKRLRHQDWWGAGATRFVSGSERCLPRSCKLLMHFREEWHENRALRTSATPTEESRAARESIAVISGSGSDNATTPKGGNAAESSSPEREREPSDAAIDIWSSGGAPKETGGVPRYAKVPARSNGIYAGCGVLEGWGTPLGEALTVILKSPLTLLDAPPPWVLGRTPNRGRGRETPPCLT